MKTISFSDLNLRVAPPPVGEMLAEQPSPGSLRGSHFSVGDQKLTVGDVALSYGLEVGKRGIRVIGYGDVPDLPFEQNGWFIMAANAYPGIVPQEALETVKILLDEGVEIKELLIADDMRNHRLGILRRTAARAIKRVREIEWQEHRAKIVKCLSVSASVVATFTTALSTRTKDKVKEIPWAEVRSALWSGTKVVAIVAAGLAFAALALPLLAVAAVPAAVVTLDPWLIVVDSENRWWVVAEWWD